MNTLRMKSGGPPQSYTSAKRGRERGQAIMEAAVMLPVLVFVALGLIDIQWTLERLANLNYIVTETARCEAIAGAPCSAPNTPQRYVNRLAEDLRMDTSNLTWNSSSGCNEVSGLCTVTISYRYKPLGVWFPSVTLRRTGSAALPHPPPSP